MRAAVRTVLANPYVRTLVLLLAAVGLFLLLRETRLVWGSFLLALLIAYLLLPIVDWIESRGAHRGVGVLVVAVLVLMFLLGVGLLGVAVGAQLSTLANQIPRLVETLREVPFMVARLLDPTFDTVFQQVFMTLNVMSERLVDEVLPSIQGFGSGGVNDALAALGSFGTAFAAVLVLSLYLLYQFPGYARGALDAVPERHRPFAREIAEKVDFSIGGFLRGQILIAVFVGVLTSIGLTLLGVPLSLVLGVLAGVFNLIPFFGPLIVAVPTAVLAMTGGFGLVVAALGVLLLVNVVDGNVVTPLVYSRTISVDPITIIVVILLGATLFGLVGALVAVPIAAFVKLIYRDYYRESRWFRGERTPAPPAD